MAQSERERERVASKHITVLEHPPYLSDLDPNEFFVPKVKGNVENKAF
jgi:hypothetical protein